MKVVALVSGGKDSCYNMIQCVHEGHEIVALANLKPESRDELDSYMFQTVGHDVIHLYAEAIGLPLYRGVIKGESLCRAVDYDSHDGDEVEDLFLLLKDIKSEIHFDAVAVGAVLSDYQRVRVENVCSRLGLQSLSYLWQRHQEELLDEMISCDLDAIVIKVACLGLDPRKHLGKTIKEMFPLLQELNKKYGAHVCGEGGEYETLTLDCPLFVKRIVIDKMETVIHSDDAFAPVGYLRFTFAHLEDKNQVAGIVMERRLDGINIFRPSNDMHFSFKSEEKEISMLNNTLKITSSATSITPDAPSGFVVRHCGPFLFVSGISPTINTSKRTIEEVTQIMLQKLKDILEENKSSLENALLLHLYVKDLKYFSRINQVYKTFFKRNPSSRVCVQAVLPDSCPLRIDCLSVLARNNNIGTSCLWERKSLHVRSISHWTPANIGPYSQAIKYGPCIYVSGSIGLVPGLMKIIDGGIEAEAPLALRHVDRVIKVISHSSSLNDAVYGVCYVTSTSYLPIANYLWTKETQIEGKSKSVFQVAVVPELPKSACVEWHVGLHSCEESNRDASSLSSVRHCLRIKTSWCSCPFHKMGYFISNIGLSSGSDEINLDTLISDLHIEIKACLSTCEFDMKHILSMRIFYIADKVDESTLLGVISRYWAETEQDSSPPPITFVPVQGILDQAFLSVLCQVVAEFIG